MKSTAPEESEDLDTAVYSFPAIRGMQAGREYYSAMVQLKLIPTIFRFNESEVPPQIRSQRVLNQARIPEIANYIVNNPRDYVFSSISASISDGRVKFIPIDSKNHASKLGKLVIPMEAKVLINDGQHRRAAIEVALDDRPELGNETISVVFFIDAGLKRSQQMFSDLNRHAVRPTKSISILYDSRETFAQSVREMSNILLIFKDLTELEKTSISNRSRKMFTLSTIYQATAALLGKKTKVKKITHEEEKLAHEYWNEVAKNIPEWQLLIRGDVASSSLRSDFIHAHGIALHALGVAGHDLIQEYPDSWKEQLKELHSVDWSRSNSEIWEGRAMVNGRILKNQMNLALTTNYLKQKLKIPLKPDEAKIEKRFMKQYPGSVQ
ncbi:DNA sulfur modification protein DndB [Methanoregula sp.]|jgi:DNA sulfur modification protein DndB|uniref:DNA sulfur modification protein DndB n=1 Tax=Methanoregula sp. TaxID=2052170 RepID=UPI003C2A2D59